MGLGCGVPSLGYEVVKVVCRYAEPNNCWSCIGWCRNTRMLYKSVSLGHVLETSGILNGACRSLLKSRGPNVNGKEHNKSNVQ
jgi:hypothetical protein